MIKRRLSLFLLFGAAIALAVSALAWQGRIAAAGDNAKASSKQVAAKAGKKKRKPSSANRFNRLFRGAASFNLPPHRDGIHDPDSPGTLALQPPKESFGDLPKSRAGNRVNWVKALRDGLIEPRADRLDPDKKMTVLDLNIIREVKGTMPDVVYPHKQHTEWLDCRNCHPKIFKPKKGGNNISMASILAGQYCGVCHGKVAFPVAECRLCHSKPKTPEELERRNKRQIATYQTAPKPKAVKTKSVEVAKLSDAKTATDATSAAGGLREMSRKELMATGAEVYADFCAGCHGESGEGVPETFPPIKGSKIAVGPVEPHIEIVLAGKADTAMQAWREDLTPEELAAVITFERNAWGNHAGDVVQPSKIKAAIAAMPAVQEDEEKEDDEAEAGSLEDMDKTALIARGKEVYEENCGGCHGENGEGVPDAFPPLAGSKIVKGPLAAHLGIVIHGKEETAMQAWGEDLSPADIAAVITFERDAWGGGETVQPRDVAAAKE